MRLEHTSVDELIKKFDSIGDAELSLADRQWLKSNIKELIATATTTNVPSPSRQVETLVVPHATLLEIEQLKKDVSAWKQECEMYANAWQRELGGVYNKTHFIDALVVTTRAMKKQLNAFLGVAKKDFR